MPRGEPHPAIACRAMTTRTLFVGPFHRTPLLSSPSAEATLLTCRLQCDREPPCSLPKRARRSAHGRLLLSVFTISHACTNHTPCTRSASDTPCQVMPKPGRCQQAGRLVTGKPETRDPETERLRAAVDNCRDPLRSPCTCRSLGVLAIARQPAPARCRSLPLPRFVLSPRTGRISRNHVTIAHGRVAKTVDTRCRIRVGAHMRRHMRPIAEAAAALTAATLHQRACDDCSSQEHQRFLEGLPPERARTA